MPLSLAPSLDLDRSNRLLSRPKAAADHLPVGFRVTDRASLAGNVSRSSSSSRWSARCQSPLSSAGLVAGALFRAALLSDAWDRLAEVFIGKRSLLVQIGSFDGRIRAFRPLLDIFMPSHLCER